MNLPNFVNFEPFNKLRRDMRASKLGHFQLGGDKAAKPGSGVTAQAPSGARPKPKPKPSSAASATGGASTVKAKSARGKAVAKKGSTGSKAGAKSSAKGSKKASKKAGQA